MTYAALAVAWLALFWRDARAGPPLRRGPAARGRRGRSRSSRSRCSPRGAARRRALQAFAGVLAAAAVAGLRGRPLPLTGSLVPNLGVDGSTRVTDVLQALAVVVGDNAGLLTVAARARARVGVPPRRAPARAEGDRGARSLPDRRSSSSSRPALPALSIVLGTCALCGILAALTLKSGRYP